MKVFVVYRPRPSLGSENYPFGIHFQVVVAEDEAHARKLADEASKAEDEPIERVEEVPLARPGVYAVAWHPD